MTPARTSDLQILRRVFRDARPFRAQMLLVFIVDLLATPLALLVPIPLKIAVDSVIGAASLPSGIATLLPFSRSPSALLATAAVAVVVIATLNRARDLYATALRTRVGHALQLDFRSRLFDHAQRLSLAYHDEKGATDATYRILYDTPAVQYLTVSALPQLLGAGITFVGMTYVIFAFSARLAVVALIISPILVALAWWHRNGVRGLWTEVKYLEHRVFSIAQESFSELRIVKAFGQESRERDRFIEQSSRSMDATHAVEVSEGVFQLLLGLTVATGTGLVLFLGVQSVLAGTLSLGALLVVMAYLAQFYAPLEAVSGQVTTVQNSLVMASRAYALLDRPTEVPERAHPVRAGRVRGGIQFENVSFAYGLGAPVLQGISFSAPPGTRIGIAGRTGAGKTTFLNLLVRFYDPSTGRIRLDDVDVRDYGLVDLRGQFSIVLQDTLLFSVSIAENILYARPDATLDDVERAARAASAHDFITSLPDGYNTLVGQRGMQLSGGERQRISLARAFLRDSPILILDEPTSAVDIATERAIVEAMEHLMKGRTTFMVAHRLSTLERCDLLLVLDGGRLVTASQDVRGLLADAARVGSLEAAALERSALAPVHDD